MPVKHRLYSYKIYYLLKEFLETNDNSDSFLNLTPELINNFEINVNPSNDEKVIIGRMKLHFFIQDSTLKEYEKIYGVSSQLFFNVFRTYNKEVDNILSYFLRELENKEEQQDLDAIQNDVIVPVTKLQSSLSLSDILNYPQQKLEEDIQTDIKSFELINEFDFIEIYAKYKYYFDSYEDFFSELASSNYITREIHNNETFIRNILHV